MSARLSLAYSAPLKFHCLGTRRRLQRLGAAVRPPGQAGGRCGVRRLLIACSAGQQLPARRGAHEQRHDVIRSCRQPVHAGQPQIETFLTSLLRSDCLRRFFALSPTCSAKSRLAFLVCVSVWLLCGRCNYDSTSIRRRFGSVVARSNCSRMGVERRSNRSRIDVES